MEIDQNGLPTNENRCHRHIAQDASWEMCFYKSEDCYHATMVCPHAQGLRMAMREFWELPLEEMLHNTGLEWFLALLDSCKQEELSNLATILWRAWSVRNKVTRKGEPLLMDASVAYLKKLGQEVQVAIGASGARCRGRSHCVPIRRPAQGSLDCCWDPPGWASVKINVDGAYNPNTGEAAVGIIVRDYEGNPGIMAWKMLRHCRDAEEAEGIACLQSLKYADRWPSHVQAVLESDCANIITKVQSCEEDCSLLSAVITDINEIMVRRGACWVQKIWREQNMIAHNLGQYALKSRSSQVSFFFVPLCIRDLVYND
jgi:ribonuclease HI